jgi:hypothetical protein
VDLLFIKLRVSDPALEKRTLLSLTWLIPHLFLLMMPDWKIGGSNHSSVYMSRPVLCSWLFPHLPGVISPLWQNTQIIIIMQPSCE